MRPFNTCLWATEKPLDLQASVPLSGCMSEITVSPYSAADHVWLVERHQTLYAQHEGFDDTFGPLVSSILSDFEARHDARSEAGWIVRQGDLRLGSVFCVSLDAQTAKLRLFLLTPDARGKGIGAQLLRHCMSFAKDAGYARMSLWTHESHEAACALYTRFGWSCTASKPVTSFGVPLVEQQWEITL